VGSINISQELAKTNIWQDLVSSEKQLEAYGHGNNTNNYNNNNSNNSKHPNYNKKAIINLPVIEDDVSMPLITSKLSSVPTIVINPSNSTNFKNENSSNL